MRGSLFQSEGQMWWADWVWEREREKKEWRDWRKKEETGEGGAIVLNRCGHRGSFSTPSCTKTEQQIRRFYWIRHHAVLFWTVRHHSQSQIKCCFGTFLFFFCRLLVAHKCLVSVDLWCFFLLWFGGKKISSLPNFFFSSGNSTLSRSCCLSCTEERKKREIEAR